MLFHGPEDRDVLYVEQRDYSVYAIKEFVCADCTQGSRKEGDLLSILSF